MATTVLKTVRFGELTFDETQVVHLIGGLIGIPGTDRVLVLQPGGMGPLYWLQSVERPEVAIVIADLAQVAADYRPVIPKQELLELGADQPEQALLFGVCVLAEDPQKSTVNLRAPLVVNPIQKRGRQIVLDNEQYPLRQPLLLPQPAALAEEA